MGEVKPTQTLPWLPINEDHIDPTLREYRERLFETAELILKRDMPRSCRLVDVIECLPVPGSDKKPVYITVGREINRARGYAYFTNQLELNSDCTDGYAISGHYDLTLDKAVKDAYERIEHTRW